MTKLTGVQIAVHDTMLRLVGVAARRGTNYILPDDPKDLEGLQVPADRSTGWLPRWTSPKTHSYNTDYLEYTSDLIVQDEQTYPEEKVSWVADRNRKIYLSKVSACSPS
jgi:hypothetical protein